MSGKYTGVYWSILITNIAGPFFNFIALKTCPDHDLKLHIHVCDLK